MSRYTQDIDIELGRRPTDMHTLRNPLGITSSPQTGITGTLLVPGLATMPIEVTDGARLAHGLAQSLGLAGELAGDVYTLQRREQSALDRAAARSEAEQAKAEREQEKMQRHHDALQKGVGVLAYRTDQAKIASDIAAGKVAVPVDDKGVDTLAEQFVAKHTDGMDPVAAQEYREHALPRYTELLIDARDKNTKLATEHGLGLLSDRAVVATTPSELGEVLIDAKAHYGNLPEDALLAKTIFPALQSAAEAGDKVRFDAASTILGDRFKAERTQLEHQLNSRLDSRQRQTDNDFRVAAADLALAGTPFDEQIRTLKDEWSGKVSSPVLDARVRAIAAQKKAAEKEAAKVDPVEFDARVLGRAVDAFAADLDSGDVPGGGVTQIPEIIKIVRPDGTHGSIKRADVADAIRDQAFAGIDRQFPPTTPEGKAANLDARATYIGVKNPTLKDPEIDGAFAGISRRVDLEAPKQPKATVDGLNLYRSLSRHAAVRDAHLTDQDRTFLQTASFLMDYVTDIGPDNALREASLIGRKSMEESNRKIAGDVIRNAMPKLGKKNDEELYGAIANTARAYALIGNLSDTEAVKVAVKEIREHYKQVNGFWINTVGKPVAANVNLESISKVVVDQYLNANPGEGGEGIAKTMVLRPDRESGLWTLTNMQGKPILGTPSLSDDDILTLHNVIENTKELKDFPAKNEKYLKDAKDQAVKAAKGSNMLSRFLYTAFIGGLSSDEDPVAEVTPNAAPLTPPIEFVPHNQKLEPLIKFIKNRREPTYWESMPQGGGYVGP